MITTRELRESDIHDLAMIIADKWGSSELKNDAPMAEHYGKAMLFSTISESDCIYVLSDDGKAAGLIAGINKRRKKTSEQYVQRFLNETDLLKEDKVGAWNLMEWLKFRDKNSRFAQEYPVGCYDAEITLFVIGSEYRSRGFGKKLFQDMVRWFRNQGLKSFYLHSDSSSNHGFYSAQGMLLVAMTTSDVSLSGQDNIDLFIYKSNT